MVTARGGSVLDRIKAQILGGIAWLLLALMLAMLIWAGALVFVQCTTWLKTGAWQQVPAVAVFMSPEAQTLNLRVTEGRITPLDLAPSWASFGSAEVVTERIAGRMVGFARIVDWLLNLGLVVWLVGASVLFGGISGMVVEAGRQNRTN